MQAKKTMLRTTIRYALAAASLTLAATPAAHAAEGTDSGGGSWLEPVTVTATRIGGGTAATLPVSISVIDAQTIAERNPASLPDLLRTLPGVQLTQPGGGAGIASLYLRGCQPNYTLFLVDGVKVTDSNDSRGGSFDLSTVSPGEIERVEVIRGPQSAVYGADAICGVVNVITRSRSERWGTTVGGEAGRARLYSSDVELAGPLLERGGLALRAGTADQGDTVPGASFGTTAVNGKLTLDRGSGWQWTLHGRHAEDHGTSYPDLGGGPEFAASPARDVRHSKETSADTQGRIELGADWTLNAILSSYRHQVHFASPGVTDAIPPRGEDSDLKRQYAAVNAALKLPADLRLSAGADYLHEDTTLDGYLIVPTPFGPFAAPDGYAQTRNVVGTFGEIEYTGRSGLTLLGSLRRDDPRTQGAVTTARTGAVYSPDGGVTAWRVDWGQGFKLPSLWALGNALVGNPALLPERGRTTEIGVARLLLERRLKLDLALFDNHFHNLIDFDNNVFQFVNRREVTGQGGELEATYEASAALRVRGEATYVQVDAKDSGIPIRQRPKWRGSLELAWSPTAAWSVYGTWLSQGPMFDASVVAPPGDLGGYSRFDLSVEWRASDRLLLRLAVDNLLDKRYAEAYGFVAAGATPRVGFRYRL
jgi:vitamin B12 transporter